MEHLAALGSDETSRGISTALAAPEAVPILHKAADRFREATCNALLNWGNVHSYLSQRVIEEAAVAGQPIAEVSWSPCQMGCWNQCSAVVTCSRTCRSASSGRPRWQGSPSVRGERLIWQLITWNQSHRPRRTFVSAHTC